MKALLIPAAAAVALLTGCVGYGDPVGYGYGYPGTVVGGYPGTVGVAPVYGGAYGTYPYYQRAPIMRDRDRDGIPNRMDADRDNDGVPNPFDARPANPYRR